MKILWLDDIRNPFMRGYFVDWLRDVAYDLLYIDYTTLKDGVQFVWAKSFTDFERELYWAEVPFNLVCFDHDLGGQLTGYDAVKLLVQVCQQKGWPLPECRSQSANPVGKENILKYIENAKKHLTF